MILDKMLQRLFAGLAHGPGLNARPQNSRQRLDVMDLSLFQSESPENIIAKLLGPPAGAAEFPAKAPVFRSPDLPPEKWSDEQRAAESGVGIAPCVVSGPFSGFEADDGRVGLVAQGGHQE